MSEKKKAVYTPDYEIDIGNHVFPTSKYRLVREKLLKEGLYGENDFIRPRSASVAEVSRVHDRDYVEKIKNGSLSYADEIKLELPYSKKLAEAFFICAAGTVLACRRALKQQFCVHLGGGFHHAYPDHGEGFCVFNDVALGAEEMREKGKKVLIVDCDLHQGNGTAAAFRENHDVFTFSMHQENNYPLYKEKSDMDIPLPDGIDGREYNSILRRALSKIKEKFDPDFLIYVAGSDPYEKDQLGGLNLSLSHLEKRDIIVKEFALEEDIPGAVVFAGGYALRLEDTVEIHFNTARIFTLS